MNLSDISFPYPVLGSFDDILPAPAEPKVNVLQDKNDYHFDIQLAYDNPEIERLVNEDYADYVCEINCDMTRFRRCYKGKQLHFQIDIPRKSVAGKMLFSCTITVKKPIADYSNAGFHSDYSGRSFNMEPGDLLGMFDQFYYIADIKYDRLKAVGTFMEIVETEDDMPMTVLDKDKIELRLPKILFERYKNDPAVNSKADILHASLVMNSLVYALSRIDEHENRRWAQTIRYRIDTEPELADYKDMEPAEWKVDRLAHILLGKPYERLFDFLTNERNHGNYGASEDSY